MDAIARALNVWLNGFDLDDSRYVAITGLSRHYHKAMCKHLEGFYTSIDMTPVHLYSYHSNEGKLLQPIHLDGRKITTLEDLLNCDQIAVFFHDIENQSSVLRFTSLIRGIMEGSSNPSTVILTMRPATAFRVYDSGRSPLFGRVTSLVEPPVLELGIADQSAKVGGYIDLYKALVSNGSSEKEELDGIVSLEESEMYNILDRFWKYLLTDSRRAGLCRVVASCLAAHDSPLRIPVIAEKCGLKQNSVRVLVYSAIKTGLLKIGRNKAGRVAEIYPPILQKWIKVNIPFYPNSGAFNG